MRPCTLGVDTAEVADVLAVPDLGDAASGLPDLMVDDGVSANDAGVGPADTAALPDGDLPDVPAWVGTASDDVTEAGDVGGAPPGCSWPCDPEFPGASGCAEDPMLSPCATYACVDGCCVVGAQPDGLSCTALGYCPWNILECQSGVCTDTGKVVGEDDNPCTATTCDSCPFECMNVPTPGEPCGEAGTCDAEGRCVEP